jgi:hypothetical protein
LLLGLFMPDTALAPTKTGIAASEKLAALFEHLWPLKVVLEVLIFDSHLVPCCSRQHR